MRRLLFTLLVFSFLTQGSFAQDELRSRLKNTYSQDASDWAAVRKGLVPDSPTVLVNGSQPEEFSFYQPAHTFWAGPNGEKIEMLISSIEEFKTVDTLFKSCLTTEDKYVASYFVREPALRFHSDRSLVYRVQSGRNIVEGDSSHLRNFLKHCDQSSRWTIQVVERYGPKERVMIQYFAEKSPQALARELFRLQEVVDIASDNASQINHPWMKEVAVQASFSQQGAQELPIPKSSTIEAGNPLDSANPFGEVKANEKLKSASDDVLELFKDIEEIEVDVIGVADEVDNIIQKTLQRAERRARSADN